MYRKIQYLNIRQHTKGDKNVQHFLQKVNDPFLRKEANNIIG